MPPCVRPWLPCVALTTVVAVLAAGHALRRPAAVLSAPVPEGAAPRAAVEDKAVYDFARLNPAAAAALEGKKSRFLVVLDSPADARLGQVCYDCATPDDSERTLYLKPGQWVEDEMVVEARLTVLHYPRRERSDGASFPAFTEYRLTDAVRPRP